MWWEYFSFKFCPVFHQSALELSYFDQNWAKTRPLLFKIWKFSNSMDSRIVHWVTLMNRLDPSEWRYLMKTFLMWLAISDSYGDDAGGDGSGGHEGWQGGEHGGGHGDNEALNGRIRIVATVGRFSGMQLCTHWQPHKVGYAVRHQFALTAPI